MRGKVAVYADVAMQLPPTVLPQFIKAHSLPAEFSITAQRHYLPFADWLSRRARQTAPFLLGINGAQGTGKSTLAQFLKAALHEAGQRAAVLSIDDFYLDKLSREALATEVHPLLRVRGVPGTHDTVLMRQTLGDLRSLKAGETLRVPVFDKATDDRVAESEWASIDGPLDAVILEGWCVGTPPQPDSELQQPINGLEAAEDRDGHWRSYINDCLRERYAPIFAGLDALCYLQIPDFGVVPLWRAEQERKLAASRPGRGIMSDAGIVQFVQYFERLTRVALAALPQTADVVLELARDHTIIASRYRDGHQH
ncbi:MAG: kinase [Woeseiaceae bacterium]|nr:kinase [Woeseiaceae bacterium]